MLVPSLSSASRRRVMAVVSLGFLFLVAWSRPADTASSEPPDVFRWDQVPISTTLP